MKWSAVIPSAHNRGVFPTTPIPYFTSINTHHKIKTSLLSGWLITQGLDLIHQPENRILCGCFFYGSVNFWGNLFPVFITFETSATVTFITLTTRNVSLAMKESHLNTDASLWPTSAKSTICEECGHFCRPSDPPSLLSRLWSRATSTPATRWLTHHVANEISKPAITRLWQFLKL